MTNPRQALKLPFARRLRRSQLVRFAQPHQLCVRAERGTLWITVDGDTADIELAAGQSRVFDGGAPVIVSALGRDAVMTATPLAATPGWRQRWLALLQPAPALISA